MEDKNEPYWTADRMLGIWAYARRDVVESPESELYRLSGLSRRSRADRLDRMDLLHAAVTCYVCETPGYALARPALVWGLVNEMDWEDFPLRGHGETLMRALLEYGWADLAQLRNDRIARFVVRRFRGQLRHRLIVDPPAGDLAAIFAKLDTLRSARGLVTTLEKDQFKVILQLRRAEDRGDTRQIRVLRAKLAAIRSYLPGYNLISPKSQKLAKA